MILQRYDVWNKRQGTSDSTIIIDNQHIIIYQIRHLWLICEIVDFITYKSIGISLNYGQLSLTSFVYAGDVYLQHH